MMGKTEKGNQGNLYSAPFHYSNQLKFTRYKELLFLWFLFFTCKDVFPSFNEITFMRLWSNKTVPEFSS